MIRLFAEYAGPPELIGAIETLRQRGPVRLEAYMPYPVPEIERALGAPPSRLPIAVLIAGLLGASGAYGLQWLLNAYLYPLDVGGRPAHFPLAFVPITFEMGVLAASATAFFAVCVGGRLFRLWYPSSEAEGIESTTASRFWLEVIDVDPRGADAVMGVLRDAGALVVRRVEVAP